jgi:pilus assembly protein CpaB
VVSTVTLEVEPQQAEKIDLARHIGTLSLVLRNPLDQRTISTSGAYREALLPEDERVAPATSTDTAKPVMVIVKTKAATGAPKLMPNTSASPDKSALQVEVIRGVQKGTSVFEGAP